MSQNPKSVAVVHGIADRAQNFRPERSFPLGATCPKTGALFTTEEKFTLEDLLVPLSLRCPKCGEIHELDPKGIVWDEEAGNMTFRCVRHESGTMFRYARRTRPDSTRPD